MQSLDKIAETAQDFNTLGIHDESGREQEIGKSYQSNPSEIGTRIGGTNYKSDQFNSIQNKWNENDSTVGSRNPSFITTSPESQGHLNKIDINIANRTSSATNPSTQRQSEFKNSSVTETVSQSNAPTAYNGTLHSYIVNKSAPSTSSQKETDDQKRTRLELAELAKKKKGVRP